MMSGRALYKCRIRPYSELDKSAKQRIADIEIPVDRYELNGVLGSISFTRKNLIEFLEVSEKQNPGKLHVLLAEENSEIKGFLLFTIEKKYFFSDTVLHICDVAVDLNSQRKGIGASMLNKIKTFADEKKVDSIVLESAPTNLGFYKKQGFRINERVKNETYTYQSSEMHDENGVSLEIRPPAVDNLEELLDPCGVKPEHPAFPCYSMSKITMFYNVKEKREEKIHVKPRQRRVVQRRANSQEEVSNQEINQRLMSLTTLLFHLKAHTSFWLRLKSFLTFGFLSNRKEWSLTVLLRSVVAMRQVPNTDLKQPRRAHCKQMPIMDEALYSRFLKAILRNILKPRAMYFSSKEKETDSGRYFLSIMNKLRKANKSRENLSAEEKTMLPVFHFFSEKNAFFDGEEITYSHLREFINDDGDDQTDQYCYYPE